MELSHIASERAVAPGSQRLHGGLRSQERGMRQERRIGWPFHNSQRRGLFSPTAYNNAMQPFRHTELGHCPTFVDSEITERTRRTFRCTFFVRAIDSAVYSC